MDAVKHPENLELVRENTLLEHMTVRAAMLELECRFEKAIKANNLTVLLVPPSVAIELSDAEGLQLDRGGEMEACVKDIQGADLCLVCVWAEPPRHYTLLKLEKEAGGELTASYKDSLPKPSAPSLQRARSLLQNIRLLDLAEGLQATSPKFAQDDGWSCGL